MGMDALEMMLALGNVPQKKTEQGTEFCTVKKTLFDLSLTGA